MRWVPVLTLALYLHLACAGESHDVNTAADFQAKIDSGQPHLVLFTSTRSTCATCLRVAPLWASVARQAKDGASVAMVTVDCARLPRVCALHGVDRYPRIELFAQGKDERYIYYGNRRPEKLHHFLSRGGAVKDAVHVSQGASALTEDTYEQHLAHGSHFVLFHARWCSHCQAMLPAWRQLALTLANDPTVDIAMVECEEERALCQTFALKGYPTMLFIQDGAVQRQYEGHRDVAAMLDFVHSAAGRTPPPGTFSVNSGAARQAALDTMARHAQHGTGVQPPLPVATAASSSTSESRKRLSTELIGWAAKSRDAAGKVDAKQLIMKIQDLAATYEATASEVGPPDPSARKLASIADKLQKMFKQRGIDAKVETIQLGETADTSQLVKRLSAAAAAAKATNGNQRTGAAAAATTTTHALAVDGDVDDDVADDETVADAIQLSDFDDTDEGLAELQRKLEERLTKKIGQLFGSGSGFKPGQANAARGLAGEPTNARTQGLGQQQQQQQQVQLQVGQQDGEELERDQEEDGDGFALGSGGGADADADAAAGDEGVYDDGADGSDWEEPSDEDMLITRGELEQLKSTVAKALRQQQQQRQHQGFVMAGQNIVAGDVIDGGDLINDGHVVVGDGVVDNAGDVIDATGGEAVNNVGDVIDGGRDVIDRDGGIGDVDLAAALDPATLAKIQQLEKRMQQRILKRLSSDIVDVDQRRTVDVDQRRTAGADASLPEPDDERFRINPNQEGVGVAKPVSASSHSHMQKEDSPSAATATSQQGGVVEVSPRTFPTLVAKQPMFVFFYAPWCSHCTKFAPLWKELAKRLAGHTGITVAKFNCQIHQAFCQRTEITSFPELVLFKTAEQQIHYSGARDLESFYRYVLNHVPSVASQVEARSSAKDGTQSVEGESAADASFSEFSSVWHLAVDEFQEAIAEQVALVLFTSVRCQLPVCQQSRSSLEKLASDLSSEDVTIAQVDCARLPQLCDQDFIAKYNHGWYSLYSGGRRTQAVGVSSSFSSPHHLHEFVDNERGKLHASSEPDQPTEP